MILQWMISSWFTLVSFVWSLKQCLQYSLVSCCKTNCKQVGSVTLSAICFYSFHFWTLPCNSVRSFSLPMVIMSSSFRDLVTSIELSKCQNQQQHKRPAFLSDKRGDVSDIMALITTYHNSKQLHFPVPSFHLQLCRFQFSEAVKLLFFETTNLKSHFFVFSISPRDASTATLLRSKSPETKTGDAFRMNVYLHGVSPYTINVVNVHVILYPILPYPFIFT